MNPHGESRLWGLVNQLIQNHDYENLGPFCTMNVEPGGSRQLRASGFG